MARKKVFFGAALALAAAGAGAAEFYEAFEDAPDGALWSGDYTLTTALQEIKEKDRALFGNDTRFVRLDAGLDAEGSLHATSLAVPEDSVLRFRYRTEIAARARQTFVVRIDGADAASYEGVGSGWRTARLPLAAGRRDVSFLTTAKRAQVSGGYNAVYLDDVALVPDRAVSLELFPRGALDVAADARGPGRLRFRLSSLRSDGSVKEDAEPAAWDVSGGAAVDADGYFAAPRPGAYTAVARRGGLSSPAANVTVHGADFMRRPYAYPGTGKTYAGFVAAAKDAPPAPAGGSLRVSYPPAAAFEADAFFTLEGTVDKPKARNYARVKVIKEPDGSGAAARAAAGPSTWYVVKDTFSTRIWLPFGPGRYRVVIQVFDTVNVTSPPGGGEGVLRGGTYSEAPFELAVTNTRAEAGVDGDGRWIYPSFNVQADDFAVSNLARSLTAGLPGEREKIAAVHDWVVSALVYDQQSFRNPSRMRKMDAASVVESKTGVCEGYAYLSAALLRCAGIPARIVTSRAINHAWNHVYCGGRWLFYDATWDDPVPDRGPEIVGRTYFLLESLSGGDRRHNGEGRVVPGDVVSDDAD